MTSKSTKKDYKAMYLAQKKETDLLVTKLKEQDKQLEKYKKAEKAYKTKFGREETRLTSQEMKEIEKRAREEEDEEPKFVIDLNYNKHWYEESYCPVCYNDISIDDVYDPLYEKEAYKPEDKAYVVCNRIRYFFEGNKEQPIATQKPPKPTEPTKPKDSESDSDSDECECCECCFAHLYDTKSKAN